MSGVPLSYFSKLQKSCRTMSKATTYTASVAQTNVIATVRRFLSSTGRERKVELFDFGVKLVVLNRPQAGKKVTILQVSVPGWERIRDIANKRLTEEFGACVSDGQVDCAFEVNVSQWIVSSGMTEEAALTKLAGVRNHALGSPFFYGLKRIVEDQSRKGATISTKTAVHVIKLHRYGLCYCRSEHDKLLLTFEINVSDKMEQSLARQFCQEFAQAKHFGGAFSCEPPKDVASLVIEERNDENNLMVGFLSFIIFPTYVRTPAQLENVVNQMVNLFPYMDSNVKSTKSYLRSRMRAKEEHLLRNLTPLK